jgi:hypothetical protein
MPSEPTGLLNASIAQADRGFAVEVTKTCVSTAGHDWNRVAFGAKYPARQDECSHRAPQWLNQE